MAERKKLLLRLDPRVYDAIARWAADDLRSVNAQIEYALRMALRSVGRTPKPTPTGKPTPAGVSTEHRPEPAGYGSSPEHLPEPAPDDD